MNKMILVLLILMTLVILIPQIAHATIRAQPPIQKLWESEELGGWVKSIAWSPDGTKIAVGIGWREKIGDKYYYHGEILIFSSSGKLLWKSNDLGERVESVAWSPDGTKIAVGVGRIVIVFSSSGELLWKSLRQDGYVQSIAWSPDSTKIAIAITTYDEILPRGMIAVFSSSGELLWKKDNIAESIAWSPDGIKIAVGGGRGVDIFSSSGLLLWNIEGFDDNVRCVAWSPDGSKLAVGGDFGKVIVFTWAGLPLTSPTTSTVHYVTPESTWSLHTTASTIVNSSSSVVGFNWFPAILVVGVGSIVSAILFTIRIRRRSVPSKAISEGSSATGGVAHPRDKFSRSFRGGSFSKMSDVSYDVVESVLGMNLNGLISGYGCIEGYTPREVMLRPGIAPNGFEGLWKCCLLGCGGWGCAYLCSQNNREVVFKVPRGFESIFEDGFVPTVDVGLLERIRNEAEVLRGLKHPCILRLLGVAKSVPVLAYEFAEGGSLDWQLSHGWSPSLRDVLLIGIQVGDALRYIHSRGLIHGDIKPGNIFIKNGVAKVGDFSSIVRLVTMSSRLSRLSYTPGFRSPEQVFADLRRRVRELGLESRIDTYLLGNLLLYLLTRRSVDGEEAVGSDEVEKATEAIEDPELREVIREALNPNPLQRPSTEEVVKKLLRIWISRYGKQ